MIEAGMNWDFNRLVEGIYFPSPHVHIPPRSNDTQRVLLPQFYETHLDTVDQRSVRTQRRG